MIKVLLIVLGLFLFSNPIHAKEYSAAEIEIFCGKVENTIVNVVNARDAYLRGDTNGDAASKDEYIAMVDKGMDRLRKTPSEKTKTRVYWLILYVYNHPKKDLEELQNHLNFECKSAMMDGVWD